MKRISSPKAARKGAYLLAALRARLGDHPHVGDVRGKGLMCAVDFVKDRDGKTPFAPDEQVGARIHAQAIARGLFSRVRGDTFVLAPPYVIEDDLLERIADVLAGAINAATPFRLTSRKDRAVGPAITVAA
jgi:adenosylmethionine-8-amino-7-oxononanoate aminotransferase